MNVKVARLKGKLWLGFMIIALAIGSISFIVSVTLYIIAGILKHSDIAKKKPGQETQADQMIKQFWDKPTVFVD